MIRVIQKPIVARSLQRLRGQKTHPLFAGYLYLQQRAAELNRLDDLPHNFVEFYLQFFQVKDHPIGTPYIKPFTNQKASDKNLWLNENVAGSYAPSSLRLDQPFRKVVNVTTDGSYSLRPDHAKRALKYLLYNTPVSVAELSALLYRDFGLFADVRTISDLIACFAVHFGYVSKLGASPGRDFKMLYDGESAEKWDVDWLEPAAANESVGSDAAVAQGVHLPVTAEHVRSLSADDLLGTRTPRNRFPSDPPLKELSVEGLLSFGDKVTFDFGRLNLLVGPNGSGKSNLIDCLRLFREMPVDIQTRLMREGFDSWLYNGLDKETGRGELRVVVRVPELAEPIRHQLRLGPPSRSGVLLEELVDSGSVDAERSVPYFVGSYRSSAVLSIPGAHKRRRKKHLNSAEYNPFQSILSQVRDLGQYPEITRLANLYASFRIYSEWCFGRESKLRDAASPTRSDPQLSEGMNDLPATLNALLQTPTHEKIRKRLPELKETYQDYVTRIVWGQVGLEMIEANLPVPATRLSDGTLRFLALATVLLRPDPPPLVCLEEPELGMHPDMIRMVADMIIDASARIQLIITTHSEHLLTSLQDHFDVLFAFNGGPRGTVVERLSQQDFHNWRSEHLLGDLWTSGELGGVRY